MVRVSKLSLLLPFLFSVEVGEPPTVKRCDELKVPVDKEGMAV